VLLVDGGKMNHKQATKRLDEIKKSIEKENISYGEIAELQTLIEYIDDGDVVLLEWAGVPEGESK
jgi:polyhydroxyalkanoate synthesis regulator phasin